MSEQPNPVKNDFNYVVDDLIKELNDRKEKGISTYGVALQPFNKRNSLRDAKEELLDYYVYLTQWEKEREVLISFVRKICFDKNQDIEYRLSADSLLEQLGEL